MNKGKITLTICKDKGRLEEFLIIFLNLPLVLEVITFPFISSRTSPTSISS